MRICYVLAYRAPSYIRTRTLLAALNTLPAIECHTAINTQAGLGRYRETLTRVAQIKKRFRPDAYILGFRGHELYWPLRSIVGRRPIIFDCMMSPSLALAEEGGYGLAGRVSSRIIAPIEKDILRGSDFVLTDTQAHVNVLIERYQLATDRIAAVPIGAVETAPSAHSESTNSRLRVLFYGSFLPLHGLDVILQAARKVQNLPMDFDFIGGNDQVEKKIHQALQRAGNLDCRVRRWVDFDDILATELPNADLCLGGPFGNTPQARRVITGKTSQALAQAVPTVVGAIEEGGSDFIDRHNCLVVSQGQPHALAQALRWAYEHRDSLPALGASGQRLYRNQLSLDVVAQRLVEVLGKF